MLVLASLARLSITQRRGFLAAIPLGIASPLDLGGQHCSRTRTRPEKTGLPVSRVAGLANVPRPAQSIQASQQSAEVIQDPLRLMLYIALNSAPTSPMISF